jgi:hypothetical protein
MRPVRFPLTPALLPLPTAGRVRAPVLRDGERRVTTGDRYNITAFRHERDETDASEHDHMTGSGPVDDRPTADADGRRRIDSDTPARESVGVLDLVEEPEAFEAAVAEATSPVAVVGEPFSGRDVVLDATSDRLGATRIRLGPGDGIEGVREVLDDGPVVVGGCHHLFTRRIGGFEPVERFLRALARAGTTVVTGWNRYAWSYLSAVLDVDREFPARVAIRAATAAELADRLLAGGDPIPTFVRDAPDASGALTVRRYTVRWRGRTASVPLPVPNRLRSTSGATGGDLGPKEATFERLAAVSNGNRGAAADIWERHGGPRDEVHPGDLVAAGTDADLSHEDAFCLRLVLSKEVVDREELTAVVGERTDRVLGRLVRAGLVTVDRGVVSLVPAGVPTAVTVTERWGIP